MKNVRLAFVLTAILLLSAVLSVNVIKSTPYLFADEAVYHAMTVSLAKDFDLKYERQDLIHIFKDYSAGPRGIVLRHDGSHVYYAKPFFYSLVCAPFYLMFGMNGFLLVNMLSWLLIFYWLLRIWRFTPAAFFFGLTVLGLSAFLPYTVWLHPEVFTASMTATFLAAWRIHDESTNDTSRKKYLTLMGISLGIAVMMKPPVIILGLAPILDWLGSLNIKKIGRGTAIWTVTIVVILLLSLILTGTINPYSGDRKIFNDRYPLESPEHVFESMGNSWSTESAGFHFSLSMFLWNIIYFWAGRFSGMIPYFFAGTAAMVLAFFHRDRIGIRILIALFVSIIAEILLIPTNYHGGGGALGNRYFVVFYPAMLMALPRPPGKKSIAAIAIISACLSSPFITQVFSVSYRPGIATQNAVYRLFPAEWTLVGSYPIFNPAYRRIAFDHFDGYFYFLDKETYGKEGRGFHVKGNGNTEMIISMNNPVDRFRFQISGAPVPVDGEFIFPGGKQAFSIIPDTPQFIEIPSASSRRFIDIYGNIHYIYRLSIRMQGGGIPKYAGMGGDSRFISAFFTPVSQEPGQHP